GLKPIGRGGIEKVELDEFDARDRCHVEDVERDNLAACANAARGNLAPAARRRAEISDARALFQEMKLIVDLGELEGRARAIAFALGARHIGIVDLTFEPGTR